MVTVQHFTACAKRSVVIRSNRTGPREWLAKREDRVRIKGPGLEHVIDEQRLQTCILGEVML